MGILTEWLLAAEGGLAIYNLCTVQNSVEVTSAAMKYDGRVETLHQVFQKY